MGYPAATRRGLSRRPGRSRRDEWRARQRQHQAKEEAPEKEAEGAPDSPLPLLDLSDAGVKKMIKAAKKRGYVTYEQLNAVLPSEEVTSEQIEDMLAMLSEMGINVVETEDAESEDGETEKATDETADDDDDDDPAARWSRPSRSRSPSPRRKSRPSAPTIPCACICARWARSNCSRARAKSPSPSASRPAARP